ncbi:MAG: HAD family hydrolase [Planctomycetes bacterium]|nr:HAD family hydrolase [Planctomycetota bacterium]
MSVTAEELKALQPEKEFFIGIDSDGCVFDSMEPKHKECFCPTTIWKWNLEVVSKYAREAWDFVNLYGRARGCNRFLALLSALDYLRERPEVQARNADIASLVKLREWTKRESKLGNPALQAEIDKTGDEELSRVLDWSEAINESVERIVRHVPPFPGVPESLAKAVEKADMMVVSSTPVEALEREWVQNNIAKFVRVIAGQECGSKSEHLTFAAKDKYPAEKSLMIGDAYGDLKAAKAINALFYPILPGQEEESWARFHDEALDRFFAGTYKGAYEDELAHELAKALPETPPWM